MDSLIASDYWWFPLVIPPLLPLVNGVILKWTVPSAIKGAVLAGLCTLTGLCTQLLNGEAVWTRELAVSTAIAWVLAVGTYLGILKPANLTSTDPTGKLLPQIGIGPKPLATGAESLDNTP